MMTDQRKHVAHGMAHERTAVLHWLRTDTLIRNAVEFELTRDIRFVASIQASDILNLIADNLEGSEHWKDESNDDAQSPADDTRTRAAV